jgi:uncharacterized membrane protein
VAGVSPGHPKAPAVGLHHQRGAAAVFAAISILAGLIAAGLAIDLGRLYFTQRDLQRVANLAALDSVRVAGGCLGDDGIDPAAVALTEARESVLRNGGQAGWLRSTAANILGRQVIADGRRSFELPTVAGNRAVEVQVSRPVPARLVPLMGAAQSTATLNARAAAYSTPSALVRVGSRPLNFTPPSGSPLNALFGRLLGGPVSLDVLSYQALFDAQVPLGPLARNFRRAPDVPRSPAALGDFMLALIDEIGDPVARDAAQAMYAAADTSRTFYPEDVVGVSDPASGSFASAGDLLTAAAASSLQGDPIFIPITLPPPLGSGETTASARDPGAPAQLVPGGTLADASNFAHNTSLVLQSNLPLDLGSLLPGITGNLSFFLQAGQSTAVVDRMLCARRGVPADTVDVSATSSITRIGIGAFSDINAPDPQPQPVTVVDTNSTLNVLGVALPIRVTISASAIADLGQSDSDSFDGMTKGEVRTLGTPGATALAQGLAAIPSSLDVQVNVQLLGSASPLIQNAVNLALSTLRNDLANAVNSAITGNLLANIDDILLPQLQALGVTIGGADVMVVDIDVAEPLLFTH